MFNQGFIKLPRSLLNHYGIVGLKDVEFRMFIILLENMCFKCCQQNDHGILVNLQPWQFMTTEREFAKMCKTNSARVHRFFDRLEKFKILKQEVKHTKTVLTLTHESVYELQKTENEAVVEAKLKQEWSRSEAEKKKVRSKEGKNTCNILPSVDAASLLEYFNISLSLNLPEIKKNSASKDSKSFDQLLQNYSKDQIREVINFSHQSDFWKSHVHTPNYLSKKFPKLLIQSNQGNKQYAASKKHIQNVNGTELDKSTEPKFRAKRTISG